MASDVLVASVSSYDEFGVDSAVESSGLLCPGVVNSVEATGESADVDADVSSSCDPSVVVGAATEFAIEVDVESVGVTWGSEGG